MWAGALLSWPLTTESMGARPARGWRVSIQVGQRRTLDPQQLQQQAMELRHRRCPLRRIARLQNLDP